MCRPEVHEVQYLRHASHPLKICFATRDREWPGAVMRELQVETATVLKPEEARALRRSRMELP